MTKQIRVGDIFPIENQDDYKIHFAVWNQKEQPLNVFLSSVAEFQAWNEHKGKSNLWTKKYIFSLVDFYHEKNT